MSRQVRDVRPTEGGPPSADAQPILAADSPKTTRNEATRARGLPPDWLPLALIPGDALISGAAVLFGYWIRYGNGGPALPLSPYIAAIPVVMLINLFALAVNRQYTSWRGRTLVDQLLSLYSGIGLGAILMLAAIEVGNLGQHFSRLTIVPTILLTVALMTTERYFLRQYETQLRRRGIGTERVLMVGTGDGSELLIRRMSMFPQYGFHVVGVAADDTSSTSFVGAPVVGRVEDMPRLVRELKVDQVFLALPASQRDRLLHLVKLCEGESLEFKIVPDLLDVMSTRAEVNAIDGLPLVGIRHNQLRGGSALVKRAIDVAISAALLVVLSPLILVIVVLIKLTMPGPVFFKQERIGRLRQPFVIYKFRSMIPDAEAATGPK
ncbi:MAG: sugar transferase, partial [Isosphaeraceae bacterium]